MSKLEMPQQGGSHVRQKDGSLKRVAFTIAPGDPGRPDTPAPVPPAAAPTPPTPQTPQTPAKEA